MSILAAPKRFASPYVHGAINRSHRHVGDRRFRVAFEQARAAGNVRIVLGAGRVPIDGWINTDIVWQQPNYLDATKPWPVPPDSVDLVYGDDVIEHVTLAQARELFRHAFIAMKPGAVIRLATPDVEAVARQYLEHGELARLGIERNRERGRDFVYPVELIREVYVGAKHYLGFCYDYESLSTEMQNAGFVARRAESGKSDVPDLVGLEVRTHPAERATALVVEGVKPEN